jgi:hypothetical protein
MVLSLNTNKTTLANYQKKTDYKEIIDNAKLKIEHSYELSLRKRGRSSDIFALKNFGWSDRQLVHYEENSTISKMDYLIQQLTEK